MLYCGRLYVFKWIHLKHKPQWILKAVSVVIEKAGGGFGGGLGLQTEIVTDSHRTICANDMFQSVSTICRAFCLRASRMYNSFYLFKSLCLSHWHCITTLLLQCDRTSNPVPSFKWTVTCLQYLLFFNNILFFLAPLFSLILLFHAQFYLARKPQRQYTNLMDHYHYSILFFVYFIQFM